MVDFMVSDPAVIACTKDAWTKVAADVTSGMIHILSGAPNQYSHTYRVTGNAAPSDLADAITLQYVSTSISAPGAIDVYVYAHGVAGSVRVDL